MGQIIRIGALFTLGLVLAGMGSCGEDYVGGDSGDCEPGLTPDAANLQTDASGQTLAKAVLEYQPTDDELKLAAAYWALLAVGYQDGTLAPAFFEARLDQQIAVLMAHYPSFVTCPEGASSDDGTSFPLRHAQADTSGCTCGVSCLPAVSDVGTLMVDVGGLGLEIFSKTDKALDLVKKIRFFADDVVNKVNAVKELHEALGVGFSTHNATKAITDGMSKADAMSVLNGVGDFVVVAGTIAGAAAAAGAAAPSLATIAAVGAVVSAGMVGVQIGGKLNTMMSSYQACTDCQAATCNPGTGGSGAGGGDPGCPVPCADNQVCLNGQCVDQTAATTCALREPSCCPGHDDSCTAPDSACYCDAYCTTAGDCCPDACTVCGFCG